MPLLLDIDFKASCLPPDWLEELRQIRFEDDGLNTGPAALFRLPIPGAGWGAVRLEITLREGCAPAIIELGDGMMTLTTNLQPGYHTIAVGSRGAVAAAKGAGGAARTVGFVLGQQLAIEMDGETLVSAPYPGGGGDVVGGMLELGFWSQAMVERIRLFAEEPQPLPALPPPAEGFHLEVTVDFVDDLLYAPWTKELLAQLFAEFKRWGVARCHWIDYGPESEGFLRSARSPSGENARKTYAHLGEILPAAVKAAHSEGIELYALFKPFEMGLSFTAGEGTRLEAEQGKVRRIGGATYWMNDMATTRRDLVMARKPGAFGDGPSVPFTQIDLVKEDSLPAAFTVDDLELWVSDDNVTYRAYDGTLNREELEVDLPVREQNASSSRETGEHRLAHILRLSGLAISSRYFGITVNKREGSFANSLVNLVRVFSAEGEERMLTPGVMARRVQAVPGEGATSYSPDPDFRRDGVEFDLFPGTPTAVYPGFNAYNARFVLDAGEGFIAFARGKDRGTVAALSPSFPEVREWWLSRLKGALDAGVDGVELRVRHHHSPFSWEEFGFEAPVRERYLERYGVDLWGTDDFDPTLRRQLRGEDYTQFCREAKALVASYGKRLGFHISPSELVPAGFPGAMEINWDWRAWIEEGLADSLTLKEVSPGSAAAREVMALAQARAIPVIYSPYANHLWTSAGGEKVCEERFRLARAAGCHGFQFYENAAVIRGTPEGRLEMRQPALRAVFERLQSKQ